jgi:pilus assembly protein Flp/PilA
MSRLVAAVKRFLSEEEGVTAIEYGLIAALIAVVIIAAVTLIGTRLTCTFNRIAACLVGPGTAACTTACT